MTKAHGTGRGSGNDPQAQFTRNLRAQEASLWTDYLKRGSLNTLNEWRGVVHQLRALKDRA